MDELAASAFRAALLSHIVLAHSCDTTTPWDAFMKEMAIAASFAPDSLVVEVTYFLCVLSVRRSRVPKVTFFALDASTSREKPFTELRLVAFAIAVAVTITARGTRTRTGTRTPALTRTRTRSKVSLATDAAWALILVYRRATIRRALLLDRLWLRQRYILEIFRKK